MRFIRLSAVPQDWLQRGQEPVTATRIGNLIFTSGVPGIDPKTGALAEGPETSIRLCLRQSRGAA